MNPVATDVPGTVVSHSPASSRVYLGAPSIAVLPGGEYVISHQFFGPGSTGDTMHICLSFDRGRSWECVAEVRPQFWSTLFYHDKAQHRLAVASKRKLAASGRFKGPIVTRILPAAPFYDAEAYHQDYYRNHPDRYRSYKSGSGREHFIKSNW